ncbi:hypothetical protein DIPPA_09165 [Diplonema papillatum]|nr:hypothetical protein DIPPA_09165 [Diplonema papillatum]|eukprot:gene2058-3148_t
MATESPTISLTRSFTLPTATESGTLSLTGSLSKTTTATQSKSISTSASLTVSATIPTLTASLTATSSFTHTPSLSVSITMSVTHTPTHSVSLTYTSTASLTFSVSRSISESKTFSQSSTASVSESLTSSQTLLRFENYTTALWPEEMLEGQEVRLSWTATVDGRLFEAFNATKNAHHGELEVRVYAHDAQYHADCAQYIDNGREAVHVIDKYGVGYRDFYQPDAIVTTAFVLFTAPHRDVTFLVCFKHRPQANLWFEDADRWLLYTTDGYYEAASAGRREPPGVFLFNAKESGVWFEVTDPTILQYASIRVRSLEPGWNFTDAVEGCSALPRDAERCAEGDNLKIVPRSSPCSAEAVDLQDLAAAPFPGSLLVDTLGRWLPAAYPTLTAGAVPGGVGVFGDEWYNPIVDNSTASSRVPSSVVLAFVRLPGAPGAYDVCFSARAQRAAWAAAPPNATDAAFPDIPSRPLWRKIWRCAAAAGDVCGRGAPRGPLGTATAPAFEVAAETLVWSMPDVTEETWGVVRVAGAADFDLSPSTSNGSAPGPWYYARAGGDVLRTVLVERAGDLHQKERSADPGCWLWDQQRYPDGSNPPSDGATAFVTGSDDLRALPYEASGGDDAARASLAFATVFTGALHEARYFCYKKAACGSGWRLLGWDAASPLTALAAPADPWPQPLRAGPYQGLAASDPLRSRTVATWRANDTREGVSGPFYVGLANATASPSPSGATGAAGYSEAAAEMLPVVFDKPVVVRLTPSSVPCEFSGIGAWESMVSESRELDLGWVAEGAAVFVEMPARLEVAPGAYRVCLRHGTWRNWQASPVLLQVAFAPALRVDILDDRTGLEVAVNIDDFDARLSTADEFKLVDAAPFLAEGLRPHCEAPSSLSFSVVSPYCPAGPPLCGSVNEVSFPDTSADHRERLVSETPSVFKRTAAGLSAARVTGSMVGGFGPVYELSTVVVTFRSPGPGVYKVCYRQSGFTRSWVSANETFRVQAHDSPVVSFPDDKTSPEAALQTGMLQGVRIEGYPGPAVGFAARMVACSDAYSCVAAPAGTPASRFESSTAEFSEEWVAPPQVGVVPRPALPALNFTIALPGAAGCYYLCYSLSPHKAWHRHGPVNVAASGLAWQFASANPRATALAPGESVTLLVTSAAFPLDTAPAGAGGAALQLQRAHLTCGGGRAAAGTRVDDLDPGDGLELVVSYAATIPFAAAEGEWVTYKVCLFADPTAAGRPGRWMEVPGMYETLTVSQGLVSYWYLADALVALNTPGVTFPGISTVYEVSNGALVVGLVLHHAAGSFDRSTARLKVVQEGQAGACTGAGVLGADAVLAAKGETETEASLTMPHAAGAFLVCFSAGGAQWVAVPERGGAAVLTVAASAERPSFVRLNGSSVLLSRADAAWVSVASACTAAAPSPPPWTPVATPSPTDATATAAVQLPPGLASPYPQTITGRYAVCAKLADGTVHHAWNAGDVLSGGGTAYYQSGRPADAIEVTPTDETTSLIRPSTALSRFLVFDGAAQQSEQPPEDPADGTRSFSVLLPTRRVVFHATLFRLSSAVPYGDVLVWLEMCPAASAWGDLACKSQSPSFDLYNVTGKTCLTLNQGTALFDIRISSRCPSSAYGCGFRVKAVIQGTEVSSKPLWVNVRSRTPDAVFMPQDTTCLSGMQCNIRVQAASDGVIEVAPLGTLPIRVDYDRTGLVSGHLEDLSAGWTRDGVVDIAFSPVLRAGLTRLPISITAELATTTSVTVTVVRPTPAAVLIADLIPKDASLSSLRRGRSPAPFWHPELDAGYVEAAVPYTVVFTVVDERGNPVTDLDRWTCRFDLQASAEGNALLDASVTDVALLPDDLNTSSSRTTRVAGPPVSLGHGTWTTSVRILNNVGCGRWDPCPLQLTVEPTDPDASDGLPEGVRHAVSVSVRVPGRTVRVVSESSLADMGEGIRVFAQPGTPGLRGAFYVDEYHAGGLFAWLRAAGGSAALTPESAAAKRCEKSGDSGYGAALTVKTAAPCAECGVTFHSTAGAGPDPGASSDEESFGVVEPFTLMSDVASLRCPAVVAVRFHGGASGVFDLTAETVNRYGARAEWPGWRLVAFASSASWTPVVLSAMGRRATAPGAGHDPDAAAAAAAAGGAWAGAGAFAAAAALSEGSALFPGWAVAGGLVEGVALNVTIATVAGGGVPDLRCKTTILLVESPEYLSAERRIRVVGGAACAGGAGVCSVAATTSAYFPVKLTFVVERSSSFGWTRDPGCFNFTVGTEPYEFSGYRPALAPPWTCDSRTQVCESGRVSLPSMHDNRTLTDEVGERAVITHGRPALRVKSSVAALGAEQQAAAGAAGAFVYQGAGAVSFVMGGEGVTPVKAAPFVLCLLAPPGDVEGDPYFLTILTCQRLRLTLAPHTAVDREVRVFRPSTLPAYPLPDTQVMLDAGVGDHCGKAAEAVEFLAVVTYRWPRGDPAGTVFFFSHTPAESITARAVGQTLVDAADWTRQGESLAFAAGPTTDPLYAGATPIRLFGLLPGVAPARIEFTPSGPAPAASATRLRYGWNSMAAETGHSVTLRTPAASDSCFVDTRWNVSAHDGAYTALQSNAGLGWDVAGIQLMVGVPFPLQFTVLTAAGVRASAQEDSLVKVELAGAQCGEGGFAVGVLQQEGLAGRLGGGPVRTNRGQATFFVTLTEPCGRCAIKATLCRSQADTVERCWEHAEPVAHSEPPLSRRTATRDISTAAGAAPHRQVSVVSQVFPTVSSLGTVSVGDGFAVSVAAFVEFAGGWVARDPGGFPGAPPEVTSRPVVPAGWAGASVYGDGGFLVRGAGACGAAAADSAEPPTRWLPAAVDPDGAGWFRFHFQRPCGACEVWVRHRDGAGVRSFALRHVSLPFDVGAAAGHPVARFEVRTCAQWYLMAYPVAFARKRAPFHVSVLAVDASNVPAQSDGGHDLPVSITERIGNFGGEISLETYYRRPGATPPQAAVTMQDGVGILRVVSTRGCWRCTVSVSGVTTSFAVTAPPDVFVVTAQSTVLNESSAGGGSERFVSGDGSIAGHAVFRSSTASLNVSYEGYVGDATGDKSLHVGGPSALLWQREYQRRAVTPVAVSLAPGEESAEVFTAPLELDSGPTTVHVSRPAAVRSLRGPPVLVVDGSLSGPLHVVYTSSPTKNHEPAIRLSPVSPTPAPNPIAITPHSLATGPLATSWLVPPTHLILGGRHGTAAPLVNTLKTTPGQPVSLELMLVGAVGQPSNRQYFPYVTPVDGGVFAAVTVSCARCPGCEPAYPSEVAISEGTGQFEVAVASGTGSCTVSAAVAGIEGLLPQQAVVEVRGVAVTHWYWGATGDLRFSTANATAPVVEAEASAANPLTLLLRPFDVYLGVFVKVPTAGRDAPNLVVATRPSGCLRVSSQEFAEDNSGIVFHAEFSTGRCVLLSVENLTEGVLKQVFEVQAKRPRKLRVLEAEGFGNTAYNVSGVVEGKGLAAAGVPLQVAVEVTTDGGELVQDFYTVVTLSALRNGHWVNATTRVAAGFALLSFTPPHDTFHTSHTCATNSDYCSAPSVCCWPTGASSSPLSVSTAPWRLFVSSPRNTFDFTDSWDIATVSVVTSFRSASAWAIDHQLGAETPIGNGLVEADNARPQVVVLSGSVFDLKVARLDGSVPENVHQDGGEWVTVQVGEEPCRKVGWPGESACVVGGEGREQSVSLHTGGEGDPPGYGCARFVPPECPTPVVEWRSNTTAADQPIRGLFTPSDNGVAVIRGLTVATTSGFAPFLLVADDDRIVFSGRLRVKAIQKFTVSAVPCEPSRSAQPLEYTCPRLPAPAFYNATANRSVSTSPHYATTRYLARVDAGTPFNLTAVALQTADGLPFAEITGSIALRFTCTVGGDNDTTLLAGGEAVPGGVLVAAVRRGAATWAGVQFAGYCARGELSLLCGPSAFSQFAGAAVALPAFEVGAGAAAPPPTPAPAPRQQTAAPAVWVQYPTVQFSLGAQLVLQRPGAFADELTADLAPHLPDAAVQVLWDWTCYISTALVAAWKASGTGALLVTLEMKRDSFLCEPAFETRRAAAALQYCSNNCTTVVEFRVKTATARASQVFSAFSTVLLGNDSAFARKLGVSAPFTYHAVQPSWTRPPSTPLPASDVFESPPWDMLGNVAPISSAESSRGVLTWILTSVAVLLPAMVHALAGC